MDEFNGTYQVGTLGGEMMSRWVNGFQPKPYLKPTPPNLFTNEKQETMENGQPNTVGGSDILSKLTWGDKPHLRYLVKLGVIYEKKTHQALVKSMHNTEESKNKNNSSRCVAFTKRNGEKDSESRAHMHSLRNATTKTSFIEKQSHFMQRGRRVEKQRSTDT